MSRSSINIYDITPFTLLDFPDTPAAIFWLAGCNMYCPYCHNAEIVHGKNRYPFQKALEFLQKRRGLLEGVVISGGEPTLHPELQTICSSIKELGFLIKLDTNGSRPEVVQRLLDADLLDFVALDLKAPPYKQTLFASFNLYDRVLQTLRFLLRSSTPFEVRTTVHTDLLEEGDIQYLAALLEKEGYKGPYYIQNFRNAPKTLQPIPEQNRTLSTDIPFSIDVRYRNF
ncbi:anaerobic ribonucleoside-triphosphate reductase activating protein [Nitratiruptor sp. SB155-2]|uniref:anaerobic ribonucleoside-triphosphate reductase activating protein n=1 Tax=Nitratiruptor sp. (strain SB155-2) TaxID=387092 RepID=UPI00015870D5|nr:anaerobic ribonucleoside-triphosphate reductase activating protein [Nitratiruptor sp. SB155-2]BAF70874.1 conserved hypothetical protein [Nitratiruptor sp. SB155-2]